MLSERTFTEKVLSRIGQTEAPEPEEDGRESALTSRISGQLPTLLLRMKSGKMAAVPYPYITWYDYDPDKGITLELPNVNIHIGGHGLDHVFVQIAAHKRVVVEELSAPERKLHAGEKRPIVSEIRIEATKED